MKKHGYLVWFAYLVGAFTIFVPLIETVLQVMPMQLSETRWRYGTVGVFSRALMTPFLGLLLVLGVATYREHRRVVRSAAVFSGLFAAILVVVLLAFGLDALESRNMVRAEARRGFDIATVLAFLKYVWAIGAFLVVAIGGWKATRRSRASRAPEAPIIHTIGTGNRI